MDCIYVVNDKTTMDMSYGMMKLFSLKLTLPQVAIYVEEASMDLR